MNITPLIRVSPFLLVLLGLVATAAPQVADDQDEVPYDPTEKPGFALAIVCSSCHAFSPNATALRDAQGHSVAPYDLWQGTMKANAARDPFWKAMVAAEVAATPSRKAEIEAKCLRCHAPMASVIAHHRGTLPTMAMLDEPDSNLGLAGRDGVSCTSCHQIQPEGLGTEASFDGGYVIDASREIYGPHADPFAMPMQRMSSFTPTQSDHILDSALCGTCHTLTTHPFTPDGEALPIDFVEQAPYLEWRNSIFSDEVDTPGPEARSCQSCHMPTTDVDGASIRTRIAHNPGGFDFGPVAPREPFGRHLFVGGNTFVPALLRDHAEELGVEAPASAFDQTIAAARDQLQNETAGLSFGKVIRRNGELVVPIRIENRTGHKLPTGYPSRRIFLEVKITDGEGATLLHSGRFDRRGRLLDENGEPLPSELVGGGFEPHRRAVSAADQVAVWEAILGDTEGHPTHRLLRAARYLKDDRLLPRGWQSDHSDAERTAPVGVDGDPDFQAGSDTVEIVFPSSKGPYRVEARLHFQTIRPRFAAELFELDLPEVRAFQRMVEQLEQWPTETVATAELRVD